MTKTIRDDVYRRHIELVVKAEARLEELKKSAIASEDFELIESSINRYRTIKTYLGLLVESIPTGEALHDFTERLTVWLRYADIIEDALKS